MLLKTTPAPPCGWNSYDSYGVYIDEAAAMANLEVFAERLAPFGYEYFTLDACWYADGDFMDNYRARKEGHERFMNIDGYGRFVGSPKLFPHGLRAFSDACHAKGVKFGLHLMRGMPTVAVERNTPIKGHPTARARDILDPAHGCQWCAYTRGIDMDAPGAREYYESVAEYLVDDLQVDFIKFDDATDFPREIEAFAEALDRRSRPVVLSLSPGGQNSPVHWPDYARHANMVRITKDIWDRDFEIEQKFDRWQLFEKLGGPDCWIDLDMLPIGGIQAHVPAGTPEECQPVLGCRRKSDLSPTAKRVMMTQHALAASPLIYGGDLPMSDDDDFALVTNPEVLACDRNGIVARQVSFRRHIDVRRVEEKGRPGHGWIGVFLRDLLRETPVVERLTASELGFRDGFPPVLRDIRGEREVRPAEGVIEARLEPHGCLFFRF